MKYHWVSAVLILAAYLLFLSGISLIGRSSVGALLIIAAGACEFRFWWRFFHRPRGIATRQLVRARPVGNI